MATTPRKSRLWLALGLGVPVLFLLWVAGYRWYSVGELIRVMPVKVFDDGCTVSFNKERSPRYLPEWLDKTAAEIFGRVFEGDEAARIVCREQFRAMFHRRVDEVFISVIGDLQGDVAGALARFPNLRSIMLGEFTDGDISAEQIAALCGQLRHMCALETLGLATRNLSGDSLKQLAGHESLSKLLLPQECMVGDSVAALQSLPKLAELTLMRLGDPAWTSARQAELRAALPRVKVTFK